MAVLVDALVEYGSELYGNRWWCHMVSDISFEELHQLAERIGLPRRAFQGDHYDLNAELRERAVLAGAVETTSREIVRRMVRSPRRMRRLQKG